MFKITKFCVAHCKTINKSNITLDEAKCLGISYAKKKIVDTIEPFWEHILSRFLTVLCRVQSIVFL